MSSSEDSQGDEARKYEPRSAQNPNGDTCEEPCSSHIQAETPEHKQLNELT